MKLRLVADQIYKILDMAKRANNKSSRQHRDPRKQIVVATMKLALKMDWQEITLNHIAIEAEMPVNEMLPIFPSKNSVLKAFNQLVDAEVIENAGSVATEEAVRDRLFGLLMLRFDALADYKEAIARILNGVVTTDPVAGIIGIDSALCSMNQTLKSAGVSTGGICGKFKVTGLMAVYLKTIWVWLNDDSPGLAKTMANLDKSLAGGELALLRLSLGGFK